MCDLISRESVLKSLESHGVLSVFAKYLIEIEPVVDAVEVVRYKDCKYAKFYACKNDPCYTRVLCDLDFSDGDKFFYCSYGERKDNENE